MRAITQRRQAGFTLIEAIMVITITGLIAGVVAVFIKPAVDAYFDQQRRGEMTDIADTALRRIARDLRLAVPNSVRVSTDGQTLEFLLARTGGRYRFDAADEACFNSSGGCSSLVTRGSVVGHTGAPTPRVNAAAPLGCDTTSADCIVIFNQYNNNYDPAASDCSTTNPSAYCGHNTSTLTSVTDGGDTDTIGFAARQFLPSNGSATRRFQIIEGPVTYTCSSGQISRHSGYALRQHLTGALAGGTTAILATRVDCANTSFAYQGGAFERWGVVGLRLTLSLQGEAISLYHEAHIDNAP